ncbi:MAG: TIGR01777 family oxidoreductase [Bacteroidetes bacterium]|nr:TIGR01777 family oxidoreductase [Bacteroidota bacterium]
MATVLITGGSGLIGRALTQALVAEGHTVRWLGRGHGRRMDVPVFTWDVPRGTVDPRALDGVEHIVHLSGAGIADRRWTAARKRELHASRVDAADLLRQAVMAGGTDIRTFVSAAGIGYYGAVTTDHVFTEEDRPGTDFIAQLSAAWEQAADAWTPLCRVVKLRTAMVLSGEGGALPRLAAPVRWGAGAALGSGKQWVPWVHRDDLVQAYVRAITDEALHGAYNVAAPGTTDNRTLMRTIAQVLHRPFFLPAVPGMLLRAALGELSDVLLHGSRVSAQRLLDTGFRFRHPELRPALAGLLQ